MLQLRLAPVQDKKVVYHVVQRLARGCKWSVMMPEERAIQDAIEHLWSVSLEEVIARSFPYVV